MPCVWSNDSLLFILIEEGENLKILKENNKWCRYPETRKITCSNCRSKLQVDFSDCKPDVIITTGEWAYVAECPVCNSKIRYCHRDS